ncbi:hypothetical protein EOD41_19290 [Mucilaginibacter limnophilus]|uniref:Uncharacterized protein n=1 Tax=Mucilaginibacter limnophilus TaxID=1932778 RepID=A0A437MI36_9SPHI|nr:hypothetical protein [Mucilaginibacter limnophilus]RVT97309.1 hypothetical protein EOD41_19290 [Mucilaginibacter limnophilus]
MTKQEPLKIPTELLPDDWREQGVKKFNLSKNTIERVVYGLVVKPAIFDFMLSLAEEKKIADDLAEAERIKRLNALTSSITTTA